MGLDPIDCTGFYGIKLPEGLIRGSNLSEKNFFGVVTILLSPNPVEIYLIQKSDGFAGGGEYF